jgi:hypothetical protein
MANHVRIFGAAPLILALAISLAICGAGCKDKEVQGDSTPATTLDDSEVVQDTDQNDQNQITDAMTGVEHIITIKSDGQRCSIVDENDNTQISVNPEDRVTWKNELGSDVQLNFGMSKRLFGVLRAIVYADGPPLTLTVRPDAESGEHGYTDNCGSTQPGPVIIVNPPN